MKLQAKYPLIKLSEFVGQDHLIGTNGILKKMLDNNQFISTLLYGPPGTGKTSIIKMLLKEAGKNYFFIDAANATKQDIINIINSQSKEIFLIVDEFHRLNKDRQDLLLDKLDSGELIMFGLTTENPYMSVNKAIRSRLLICKTNSLNNEQLRLIFMNLLAKVNPKYKIKKELLDYLILNANGEARVLQNYLEALLLYIENNTEITKEMIRAVITESRLEIGSIDDYYLLLSALQKSIRGSDVDAALYYLSRLINYGDLKSIIRRLLVISYEDIGLANGGLIQKTYMAINSALEVGLPEASIILSYIVIELAISPKSNSGYLAIDKALNTKDYKIPDNLDNNKLKAGLYKYRYPHDYPGALTSDSYLPEEIKNAIFYKPKDSSNYEKLLKERLKEIDKIKGKSR